MIFTISRTPAMQLLPCSLLPLQSQFPCYIPLAWNWSCAMATKRRTFGLQWCWWNVFYRKKVTCCDRLNTSCHYVTMPSDPLKKITMSRIWLLGDVATEVLAQISHENLHVFVCLPVCQFPTSTSYQMQNFGWKAKCFVCIYIYMYICTHTRTYIYVVCKTYDIYMCIHIQPFSFLFLSHTCTLKHTPTQTHTFSCFLMPAHIPFPQLGGQSAMSMQMRWVFPF